MPFPPAEVVRFVAICALPAIPLALTQFSLEETAKWLAHAFLGKPAP
jgi:hypothetical protein